MKTSQKDKDRAAILICVLVMVSFIVCSINNLVQENEPVKILTEEQKVEQKVKAQFSNWDGSHIELRRIIKASMNDPKSFEHISTEYIELNGTIHVYTRFRGKNAFGGVVMDELRGSFNLDGELLEIKVVE